jgi:hypothetical protein
LPRSNLHRRLSYPVCVYPLRTTFSGNGDAKQASSYSCR